MKKLVWFNFKVDVIDEYFDNRIMIRIKCCWGLFIVFDFLLLVLLIVRLRVLRVRR